MRISFTKERQKEIIRRYKNGGTLREIADDYCVSDKTIMRFLESKGIPRRKKGDV